MKEITITTPRLTLVPHGSRYLKTTAEYALNSENGKYMTHLPDDSIEEVEFFLKAIDAEWEKENPQVLEFAILLNGNHIGAVSVYIEDGTGELGWIINKQYWGNGYAFEAARALVGYTANDLGISRFVAHCDAENIASYRVMEKLGMKRVKEYGGRRNKSADRDSMELEYVLNI